MPPSPIRKLVPFAEQTKREGRTVYHLNIGQPDIETPEELLRAVRNADLKVLEYTHSAGIESYRKKLVVYYERFGINIDASEILVTTGGSEAICMAMFCCLNPGDEIIIPEPFYANYLGFATEAGIVIKPVTTAIETGFALPPVKEFEKKITKRTRAILICNPNNPTGAVYTQDALEELRKVVKRHDLFLFADEVYREFCYDGNKFFSAMNLKGIEQNVVLLDSISKRYSACGARMGALITRNKKVWESALKFAQARLSPPTYAQIGAQAAVDTPDSYFEKVKAEYTARRNYLVDALNKIPGVQCPMPGGAFYCIAKLPVDDADKFCRWLLEKFNYENQTVMLAPADGFYSTKGLGRREVRIAYVLGLDKLRKAVRCLEEALKSYPGKRVMGEFCVF